MELQQLKEIATKLNYQHHHNIGANKLEEQLRDYLYKVLRSKKALPL